MDSKPVTSLKLSERDLSRWRLVEDFQERLAEAARRQPLSATWSDPGRLLGQADYLGLFLLGLLNPVVRTMRGLCAASHLRRVQGEVCTRPVSLGSFSEAQALLNPELLAGVFGQLGREVAGDSRPGQWLIQDGSLFEALPRMHWCIWRRQGKAQSQVRLHLSLALEGPPGAGADYAGQDLRAEGLAHPVSTGRQLCGRPLLRGGLPALWRTGEGGGGLCGAAAG